MPHLRVRFPLMNSMTAQFVTPLVFNSSIMGVILEYLPTMVLYHFTRSPSWTDSRIRREMKAVSPPGVTISLADPVHALLGGRDLAIADASRSWAEV